ncbi:DNA-O6-methylguanine--protein-cysteine S-methyltransferase /Transcriptional regulator Ada [Rhizobiales bacterium GAS188]|nr:DNA-O6-methylguanine--protein-cysteine S-methyltransferase /Transcriptional regulator Ada [Rhizobiales bacterium GAS188]
MHALPSSPSAALPPRDTRFADDDARWAAVRRRDPEADGAFVFAVATTGVYCRSTCASRPARRENVTFHATPVEAEAAGFRPCKRCRPDLPPRSEREAALIAEACRSIEAAEEELSLAELAAKAGLSPHHFHRIFKRITGVTPKAYAAAHRQGLVQENLAAGSGVTETIYASGFNSSGRFYEAVSGMLGMTPSAYRKGGEGEEVCHAIGRSSLGCVLVAATRRGVCAILIGDDPAALRADLRSRFPKAALIEPSPGFAELVAEVVRFVDDASHAKGLGLPLDIRGTTFQRRVWEALRAIPSGETASYAEIAERVGSPHAVRAVASACGANKLAVAIPCHRVIAADGGLAGYRWGVERKRRLLERERG